MEVSNAITICICMVGIFIIAKIFMFPVKKIVKLLINSVIGGVIIYIINLIGAHWGFSIGLNIFTSIFVGILGIPGAVVLVILKLLL